MASVTYFFKFTYACNDKEKGRLWYSCFLKGDSKKQVEAKARRAMLDFKDPKVVEFILQQK